MNGRLPADPRVVADLDMPGQLHGVGDHHVVSDLTVMRYVHVRHHVAARPDTRDAARGRRPVDRGVSHHARSGD